MTPRGFRPRRSRTVLGQRALELPTILVTIATRSLTAEDFTEGYRSRISAKSSASQRGWIIYTSGVQLSTVRTCACPYDRITAMMGTVMEMHARTVDLSVDRPSVKAIWGAIVSSTRRSKELLNQ